MRAILSIIIWVESRVFNAFVFHIIFTVTRGYSHHFVYHVILFSTWLSRHFVYLHRSLFTMTEIIISLFVSQLPVSDQNESECLEASYTCWATCKNWENNLNARVVRF